MCVCQRRISASRISGSVQTNAASLRHGSATVKTTAVMSLMKTPATAPAEPAHPDNSSAGTAAASRRAGNVTWMTTAETTRTSPSMSAVSVFVCVNLSRCRDKYSGDFNLWLCVVVLLFAVGPAYRCDNHTEFDCRTNYRCVPRWAVCNGHDDCRDNSDEQNCREQTNIYFQNCS